MLVGYNVSSHCNSKFPRCVHECTVCSSGDISDVINNHETPLSLFNDDDDDDGGCSVSVCVCAVMPTV